MNPILLGRHVEQGPRELVHSTLNTTSSGFEGAVERFLENPNHFMKGPWVTVDLPFKNIEDALSNLSQPFPDIPFKFASHIHQAKAFERLVALQSACRWSSLLRSRSLKFTRSFNVSDNFEITIAIVGCDKLANRFSNMYALVPVQMARSKFDSSDVVTCFSFETCLASKSSKNWVR